MYFGFLREPQPTYEQIKVGCCLGKREKKIDSLQTSEA